MRVTVPSFAKLNLDLRVLSKRADGFHELRTIFQTISLHDSLQIDFEAAKRTRIDLDSSVEIADNLIVKAAQLVLEQLKVKATVRFRLKKNIPMGAGMGGGSSNAAATLIALPALARRPLKLAQLASLGESLGSDVPFFLYGGSALGIGKGTELYPLADLAAHPVLVVYTGTHVSTGQAYEALGRNMTNALTSAAESPILREFQTLAWSLDSARLGQLPLKNDFEPAVFEKYPDLAAVVRKLRKLGAKPALMTGSGSALFGVFESSAAVREAAAEFSAVRTFPVRFLSRRQYQTQWRRALGTAAEASCFGG